MLYRSPASSTLDCQTPVRRLSYPESDLRTATVEGVQGAGPGGSHDHAQGQEQNGGPGREQNSGPGWEQNSGPGRPKAENPADLARLFLDRANAGDVDGVVALYEEDAVLAFPPGQITIGADAIWEVYERFLSQRPTLTSAGQS